MLPTTSYRHGRNSLEQTDRQTDRNDDKNKKDPTKEAIDNTGNNTSLSLEQKLPHNKSVAEKIRNMMKPSPQKSPGEDSGSGSKKDSFLQRLHNSASALKGKSKLPEGSDVKLSTSLAKVDAVFTLEDVENNTHHHEKSDSSLQEIYKVYKSDAKEIFGDYFSSKLKYMETNLAENPFPDPGEPIEKGTVKFTNLIGDGILVRVSNFKDSNMASFHLSDVIKIHQEKAGYKKPFECMVIKNMISNSASAFFKKHNFPDKAYMTSEQLQEFLSTVGKAFAYIMPECRNGKVSAQVLTKLGVPNVVLRKLP